jgi:hypothetical protein
VNFTIDQFMAGLENLVRELPQVLQEWASLDEELQEQYVDELRWMLSRFDEVQARAGASYGVATRLVVARLALFALRVRIREVMGVEVTLGSTVTIAGGASPTSAPPPSAPTSHPPPKNSITVSGEASVRSVAA